MHSMETLSQFRPLIHLIVGMLLVSMGIVIAFLSLVDVLVEALCHSDQCPEALYLSTIKATISGVASIFLSPIIGGLSDVYGRKPFLMASVALFTLPFGCLAISRSRTAVYAYFIGETIASASGSQAWMTFIYAYVADIIPESNRAAAFGVVSGSSACGFLIAPLAAAFIPEDYSFHVSTSVCLSAVLYMWLFLPESLPAHRRAGYAPLVPTETGSCSPRDTGSADSSNSRCNVSSQDSTETPLLHPSAVAVQGGETASAGSMDSTSLISLEPVGAAAAGAHWKRKKPSLLEILRAVSKSRLLSLLVLVSFLHNFADMGQSSNMFFVFKAKFHWSKDQFSLFTAGIGGCAVLSQLVVLPLLVRVISVQKVLLIAMFFGSIHIIIYGIAFAPWMVYLALSLSIISSAIGPTIGSLVSQMASAEDQGKLQGMVAGVASMSAILAPLTINPLTALFLSDQAPFDAPGFGIFVAGLVESLAFLLVFALPTGSSALQRPSLV